MFLFQKTRRSSRHSFAIALVGLPRSWKKDRRSSGRTFRRTDLQIFYDAQHKEISSWVKESAVRLASHDVPRERLLKTRWIFTIKADNTAKARIVIVGFADPDLESLVRTSPVMSRRTRSLFLTKSALHQWCVLKGDVRAAFLQGRESETERRIFAKRVVELSCALGGTASEMRRYSMLWAGQCSGWMVFVCISNNEGGWICTTTTGTVLLDYLRGNCSRSFRSCGHGMCTCRWFSFLWKRFFNSLAACSILFVWKVQLVPMGKW